MKRVFTQMMSYVLTASLLISLVMYTTPVKAATPSSGTLFESSGVYTPKATGVYRVVAVGKGGIGAVNIAEGLGNSPAYIHGGCGGAGYVDVSLEAGKSYAVTITFDGTASFANFITATPGNTAYSIYGGQSSAGTVTGISSVVPFPSNNQQTKTIQPPEGMWENYLSQGGIGHSNGGGGIFGGNGTNADSSETPQNGAGKGGKRAIGEFSIRQMTWNYNLAGGGGGGGYGGAGGLAQAMGYYYNGSGVMDGNKGTPGGACIYIEESVSTNYMVEHYLQNLSGDGFEFKERESFVGIDGSEIIPNTKIYTGFHVEGVTPIIIRAGAVAKIYYYRNTVTASFDSAGGLPIPAQTIRWGALAFPPDPPSKQGYDFDRWWADSGCTIAFNFATPITTNTTAYASWSPRSDTPFKVEHYQQDVFGGGYTLRDTDVFTGITGNNVNALAKTYTGFTLTAEHPNRVSSGSVAPDGSLVLKLYYERNLHSVTFDSMGGSSVPGQTGIRFEGTATEPPPPTRQGYIFGGWRADEGGTIVFSFATPITGDVTAYAAWDARTDTPYKVEHYRQEVTSNDYAHWGTEELEGITDATATAMAKPFTGFHEVSTHPERVDTGSIAPDGTLILKLFYDRNLHSVSFDTRGGSSVTEQTGIRFEGTATEPTPPSKQGYDFGGWWADEGCTISFDFTAPITADVMVYASWTARDDTPYMVEHYQQDVIGDGYTLRDTDSLVGTTDATVTALAKTYTGFHEAEGHPERVPVGHIAPDGSLVLKLYYDRDVHSVTFDTRGGSSVADQTGIRFEGTATEPMPPSKQGYDFGGWWADEGGTISFDFTAPITAVVTVYASWTARDDTPYSVEHYQQDVTGDGYYLQDTDSLIGTTDVAATAQAKSYTGFHEVTTHPDRVATGSISPDGSLILKLYYDRAFYSISFDTRGGSSVPSQTGIRFEGTAIEPTPPSKQGYDFGGWWADEDCTIRFDFATPVTADVAAYASWTPRTYLVTFNPNGGTVLQPEIQVVFDTPYGELPSAEKTDSTFVGWYTQLDGGVKVTATDTVRHAGDITVYAQWATNQVGIVDGEVTDQNGNPMPNAKVILRAGAVSYKTAMTDAHGYFTFTDVRYGTYNLVAEKESKIVTTLFVINAQQTSQTVILPIGITNSIIVVEEDTPEIVAGGLNNLFSHDEVYPAADATVVDSGGKVELRLTIAKKEMKNVDDDGRELMKGTAKPVNLLLEMTITKEVYPLGVGTPTSVESLTELPELMTIIIPLTEEHRGKTGYTVYRTHDGAVDEIGEKPNADGEYIHIQDDRILLYTRKFSLYALAFDMPVNEGFTINAIAGFGGTISPAGRVSVPSGGSRLFSITPDAGHEIADILVDGESIGVVTSYQFDRVYKHHTIEAVFKCPSVEYHDLDPNKWYHSAVDFVIHHGYMTGVGRNRWAPNDVISRAEFAAVLARLSGSDHSDTGSTYEDVSETAWYAPDVAWAQERGVGIGYDKRRFGPGDELSREQMLLMLFRYDEAGAPGSAAILANYNDSGQISAWSLEATIWAVKSGLIKGNSKYELMPNEAITRAEVAAILMRYLESL